ncbi:MAG TPA: isoprenyl transferase [Oculatellaceae cyanobacterium]
MPQGLSGDQMAQKRAQAIADQEQQKLPLEHVAVIMDGNRRWADLHNQPRFMGHKAGVKSLKNVVRHAGERQLKYLTVYAFSSENWHRSKEEVKYLFDLFTSVLAEEFEEIAENNVRLQFLGNFSQIPDKLAKQFDNAMSKTKNNQGLRLQIALNYGSRFEITEAVKQIAEDVVNKKISIEQIDDTLLSSHLYTKDIPDPELMIRTGGEMRLSNYLLWQAAYTELYVTDVLWPDFTGAEFDKAIVEFSRRIRRYGGD